MINNIATFGSGVRIKPASWQTFNQTGMPYQGRGWQATTHLAQRLGDRHIPATAIRAALDLADLCIPLEHRKMKLSCSRRAIKRASYDELYAPLLRYIRRLVLVVSEDGDVVTAWLEQARSLNPGAESSDDEMLIH